MIEDSFWLTLFVVALTFVVLWLVHELMTDRRDGQLSFRGLATPPPPVKPPSMTIIDDEEEDDLTVIEGIGPKIADLLAAAGYTSFVDVAGATAEDIKSVLVDAGTRFSMHDPSSWPKQARIADDGDWERLEKLQDQLKGGR